MPVSQSMAFSHDAFTIFLLALLAMNDEAASNKRIDAITQTTHSDLGSDGQFFHPELHRFTRSTQPGHPAMRRRSESWDVNRHTARCSSLIAVLWQCKLVSGWGLMKRRLALHYGPYGSARTSHTLCISV